jgi:hypothetical protein
MTSLTLTAVPLDELEKRVHRRCGDAEEQRDGANGLPARECDQRCEHFFESVRLST